MKTIIRLFFVGILLTIIYLFFYNQQVEYVDKSNVWEVNMLYHTTAKAFQLQSINPTANSIQLAVTGKNSPYTVTLLNNQREIMYKTPIKQDSFIQANQTNPFFDKEVYSVSLLIPKIASGRTIEISEGATTLLIIDLPTPISQKSFFAVSQAYAASIDASLESPAEISIEGENIIAQAEGTNLKRIGLFWKRPTAYANSDEAWNEIDSHACEGAEKTSCPMSIYFKPSPDIYGAPIILAVRVLDGGGTQCMGDPKQSGSWTSLQGVNWRRCGAADYKEVRIQAPSSSEFVPPNKRSNKNNIAEKKTSPTPTPVYYNCAYDENECKNEYMRALQLCKLKCDKIPN